MTQPDHAEGREVAAPSPAESIISGVRVRNHADAPHLVEFYENVDALAESVAKFAGAGISAKAPVIIIATQSHLRAFARRLESMELDLREAAASGLLTWLDADEQLATFMRNGVPEPRLFEAHLGALIRASSERAAGAPVRAYGEMVDVLWRQGQSGAAILLEELWNELQTKHSFTLYCAYAMASFYKEPADLARVSAVHTHVLSSREPGPVVAHESPSPHAGRLAQEVSARQEVEVALRDALRKLRTREDALREREEQLRDFVENATVGLHRVGPDGTILWANRAELEMLGYTEAEYVGQPIAAFHVDQDVIQGLLERLLSGADVRECEARMRAKDGSIKVVVVSSSAYVKDGRFVHTRCFTRDITERRAFERFRQEAAARGARLSKITAALAEAVTREQVFLALVDRFHEAVDATSTALWLVDEDRTTARLVRSLGYSDRAVQQVRTLPLDESSGIPVVDAMRSREPIWIASKAELLARYPHLASVVSPDKSYSVCCLPLVVHGQVLGAIGLTIESGREMDEDEQTFLLHAARYASQAVERLRLFEAERQSRAEADLAMRRLRDLNHVSRVFVETDLELGPRLEAMVSELGAALRSSVGISLLKDDGLLHTCATYHPEPEGHELLKRIASVSPIRVGEGITGHVAAAGRSILITDANTPESIARAAPPFRAFVERYPIYALICSPLRSRGQVIGTLTATRTRKDESYTPEDVQLIEQLAERAAGAIENGRLYQETVDARLRAEQLYQFAQAVVVADDVDAVFDAALAAIETALGAPRASILTLDRAGTMRFAAWRNLSDEYRRAVEGHSPWPADAVAPEPILVPDVTLAPAMAAFVPLFEREGIGALAFIPLVARRRLLGKFMIYYERPHPFPSHEVETARAIASHLASVIARFAAVSRLEDTIKGNELFAGVLAHDLLNPLQAIATGAQLLLMQREGTEASARDAAGARPLSRILSSSQRMARMIDQLLDFTRARTGGGIAVQPRPSNLGELCAEAIGELELAHPEWRIRCESHGDLTGTWDTDRLVQIISNLVANAGQHGTPEQEILVRIDGSSASSIGVEVRNAGMVPPQVLPYLFDPFRTTRVGRDRSRGLGLGLFIVNELVHAHAGAVRVATDDGSTTFTVTLPRHVSLQGRGVSPQES